MSTHAFSDFLGELDAKIATIMNHAATGMTAYVLPIGWAMLAMALLIYAILILQGKMENPMLDWIYKGLCMILVLLACSSYYSSWVSVPLTSMPTAIAAAVSNSPNPALVLNKVGGDLQDLVMGVSQGAAQAFTSFNLGGGMLLFFAMVDIIIVGSLLLLAIAFNVIYAKLMLAVVLAVGPFFVLCLFSGHTRGWFFSWLNTSLYAIFLTVFSVLIVVFFVGMMQDYLDSIQALIRQSTSQTASFSDAVLQSIKSWLTPGATNVPLPSGSTGSNIPNILKVVLDMNFTFIPMFFVALELRTLVSSITSGNGGTAGGAAERALRLLKGL